MDIEWGKDGRDGKICTSCRHVPETVKSQQKAVGKR